MLLYLLLIACKGPAGDVGPVGAQGPAGVPGAQGERGSDGVDGIDGVDGRDGPHWVDATGAVVTEGTALIWFDGNGNYWAVDAESGAVGPADDVPVYYASSTCSGDGYVPRHAPREVFSANGATISRPPDMAASALVYGSVFDGACLLATGSLTSAVPRDGLNSVWVDRSFVGPLALVP